MLRFESVRIVAGNRRTDMLDFPVKYGAGLIGTEAPPTVGKTPGVA